MDVGKLGLGDGVAALALIDNRQRHGTQPDIGGMAGLSAAAVVSDFTEQLSGAVVKVGLGVGTACCTKIIASLTTG